MNSNPDKLSYLYRSALWLATLLFACSTASAANPDEEQLRTLRARLNAVQADLNETRGERNEARSQLRATERHLGSQFKSLRDNEAQQNSASARLSALQSARSRSRTELGAHRHDLEQALRAAYLLGRHDTLKLLLSQDDPARVSRTFAYYRYFTQARAARIEGLESTLRRIDILENQITERVAELNTLRTRQLEQKNTLNTTRAEHRALLAQLNTQLRDRSKEVERLKHDEDRMARLVRELRVALDHTPAVLPPTSGNTATKGWRLPLQGRIVARFGDPKQAGDLRWRGLFLAAPEGQAVKAVSHGRVAYADWLRGFGLLLVLDHGGGLMSLYGHNQSLYKGIGDLVKTGETVAASGNTGGPPQPGLYFEMRAHGEPRNPLDWCKL